ncbi:larval/pupal rigid cuticle protein 66-like [Achroia grisella]|uniref:larval/pupal rigid cuticle protein 66-like n=1 Tax=Achroia grisella TaxID=688607 RepID=UPI0027D3505B|nr:larval/pupal rigid cuticle protein 66-like [Achroia grisella]
MATKFVIVAMLVAAAQANVDYSSFSYGVRDPHTGDVKDQHEKRVGNSVVGQYSLLEPDGTKRVVDYAANPHTGFNAVVRKEGLSVHPAPVAPVLSHAAPVLSHAAPVLSHAAPVLSHAAPVLAHAAPVAYNAPIGYSTTVAHGYAPHGGLASPLAYGGYGGYGAYGGHGAPLAGLGYGHGYGARLGW